MLCTGLGFSVLTRISTVRRNRGELHLAAAENHWLKRLFKKQGRPSGPFLVDHYLLTPEFQAVQVGLKPALRSIFPNRAISEIRERCERLGLYAVFSDFDVMETPGGVKRLAGRRRAGFCYGYIAPALESAVGLKDLEARAGRPDAALDREMGERLGYPLCCVDFFLSRRDLPSGRFLLETARHTAGPFLAELNPFASRLLVSHIPCSFHCPASLKYARTLLSRLRLDPPEAETWLVSAEGGRLRLTADPESETFRFSPDPTGISDGYSSGPSWWRELCKALRAGSLLRVDGESLIFDRPPLPPARIEGRFERWALLCFQA